MMAAVAESDDAMWGVMHDHFLENQCESIEIIFLFFFV